jgi:hypothetical protein
MRNILTFAIFGLGVIAAHGAATDELDVSALLSGRLGAQVENAIVNGLGPQGTFL